MIGDPARRTLVGAALVGAALVAAAAVSSCSYSPSKATKPATQDPSASASATATPSAGPSADTRPRGPLTGLPVEPAVATRAAVAVVVTGTSPAGLDKADIVIEETTTPTRWLALYQSREADVVGPVGATRPADLMALSVIRPAYAYRGGTNGMVEQAQKSALPGVNSVVHPELFSSNGSDLFASTAKVRAAAKAPAAKPMLPYGEPETGTIAGSKRATQVSLTLPGAAAQTWRYDQAHRTWLRVSGGPAIAVANLVVQVVPYKTIQLGRRDGGFVPSARVFGSGTSTVMTGPLAISGKWTKPGAPQLTNYVDGGSFPVRLAPGSTWVILAPTGSAVTAG